MDHFLWKQDFDFQFEPREKTESLQAESLVEQVNYCLTQSPFYSRRFGKSFRQIAAVKDLTQLGFTTKEDLLAYNPDFLAVPREAIVDTCFTSATMGVTPVNFWLTQSDLQRLAHNEQVAFGISGVQKKDIVGICVALERGFMAGMAYFVGGVSLGAQMIRIGAASPQHIWHLVKTHRPTVLVGVPSLLANVALEARHDGVDPTVIKLERILAVGEPLRDQKMKLLPAIERIEQLWNAPLYSTYASTEMATSFAECVHRQGGHFRPELIYVEIVDEQGALVKDGEIGEVVITPLGIEGMPLIRFKTGDLSWIIKEPCSCGRTTRRIGPIIGRKGQMLKYKGTNVFPNAVVSIVEANSDFRGCYIEAYTSRFGEDQIVAYVVKAKENYDLDKLKVELRAGLRVVPELKVIDEAEFLLKTQQADKRKRQIFFDLRKDECYEHEGK